MKHRKEIFASIAGHILEYYDVTLYGYFAAYLAPKFFPSDNEELSYLVSLVAFAAGFWLRPVGGLIFGHIGDRFGRKIALSWTILLVTIPTIVLGVLPYYETIGIAAPIILLTCRLLQGLCAGGEYSGAAIFVNEHAQKGRDGLASGWLACAGFAGAILGTGIGSFCTRDFMPEWGWRIPFLLGAVFGFIGFYIRFSLQETDAFKALQKAGDISPLPIRDAVQAQPLNMVWVALLGAASTVPYYASSIYMGGIFKNDLHLDLHQTLFINMSIMILWALLLPVLGHWSDRVGKHRMMMAACLATAVTTYPAFYLLEQEITLERVIMVQVILTIPSAAFVAPISALLPSLFPVKGRYSGIGFAYPLGSAIFGASTPFLSEKLKIAFDSQTAPAFYVVAVALVGFFSLYMAKRAYAKAV